MGSNVFLIIFIMAKLEENKHILIAVKIILEKKIMDNQWQSHEWEIHDLMLIDMQPGDGFPPINNVEILPLRTSDKKINNLENYFFAQASIDLHRAEAEAYAENLQSSDPSIYIVLRDGVHQRIRNKIFFCFPKKRTLCSDV